MLYNFDSLLLSFEQGGLKMQRDFRYLRDKYGDAGAREIFEKLCTNLLQAQHGEDAHNSRRAHFTTHPFQTIIAPLNFDLKKTSGLEMSASFSSTQSTAPEIERFQGLFSYSLSITVQILRYLHSY